MYLLVPILWFSSPSWLHRGIASTPNGAFVGWPLHHDIFVELNRLSAPYYLQGLRRRQGPFIFFLPLSELPCLLSRDVEESCQIVILCDRDVLHMLDLFLHLLLLGLISQPPYTPYESTSSCWPLLHCSTCLRACRWRKRSFYSWSWF